MMKVKVLRAFYIKGEPHAVGSVLDLDRPLVVELVALGKAEVIADAAPEQAPAADEKPAPKSKAKKGSE